MPVYKNEDNGTWYVMTWYTDSALLFSSHQNSNANRSTSQVFLRFDWCFCFRDCFATAPFVHVSAEWAVGQSSSLTMRTAMRSSGSSMSLSARALLQFSMRSKYTSQYFPVSHQERT